MFISLHEQPGTFVIANAFDSSSARMLSSLGFEALAHASLIVDATDLPVSADLEKGFGDAPEDVAKTIREAGEIGLVGCSIEDASGVLLRQSTIWIMLYSV